MSRRAAAILRIERSRQRLQHGLEADDALNVPIALFVQLIRRHPLASAAVVSALAVWAVRLRAWRWVAKPEIWSVLLAELLPRFSAATAGQWSAVLAEIVREMVAAFSASSAPVTAAGAAASASDEPVS